MATKQTKANPPPPTKKKKDKKEKYRPFSLVVGLQSNVDLSNQALLECLGVIHKTFQFPPKA